MNRVNRTRPKTTGGSLILSLFSRLFSTIGLLARQSLILGFFLNYELLETAGKKSRIYGWIAVFSRIKAPFLALKLKFAEYSQNCLLLNLFEDAAYRFFRSSLRSFGIFLFSFGSFLVSVNLVDGLPRLMHLDFSDTFLFGSILVVISLFLLPVKNKSIAMSLRDSKILSYFLFDIFTIKHIALTEKNKVLPTSGLSLALGLLCGLLSYAVSPWLTAFIIFMILLLYLVFTRPENGILAVCLLLPLAERKILAFLILLTLLSVTFKILRGKRSLHLNLCSGVLVLLGLIAASGTIFSFDTENAAASFGYVLLAILFALTVITLVNSSTLADKCFRTLGFSAFAAALYGVYDFSVGHLSSHDFNGIFLALRQKPLCSAFDDPRIFAAFLICLLPIMFVNRQSSGKFFSFLSLAFVSVCLVYTGVYDAVFSLVVSLVAAMILFSPYGLGTTAFTLLALSCIRIFMPEIKPDRLSAYIPHPEGFSSVINGSGIDAVGEFIRKMWLSGAGIGSESVAGASALIQAQLTGYQGFGATYVALALKIGIPLTLCIPVLLLVFLSRAFSYAYGMNKSEKAQSRCIALICSIFALMLYALFANLTGDFRICVLFLLLLSLGSAVADSADNDYIPPYFEREYNEYC